MGKPVIATDWGGPADYIDDSCGILVAPRSKEDFTTGLGDALLRLARSPAERAGLGRSGLMKIRREYDWDRKVERMLDFYALARKAGAS